LSRGRNFSLSKLKAIEHGPSIRRYVLDQRKRCPSLCDAYNACIHWFELFRSMHLEYAERYIQKQSQRGPHNPVEIGTGGTLFIPYLKKHRDETGQRPRSAAPAAWGAWTWNHLMRRGSAAADGSACLDTRTAATASWPRRAPAPRSCGACSRRMRAATGAAGSCTSASAAAQGSLSKKR
jgi:hypothetical protein